MITGDAVLVKGGKPAVHHVRRSLDVFAGPVHPKSLARYTLHRDIISCQLPYMVRARGSLEEYCNFSVCPTVPPVRIAPVTCERLIFNQKPTSTSCALI